MTSVGARVGVCFAADRFKRTEQHDHIGH
jgi:hypothetical protein